MQTLTLHAVESVKISSMQEHNTSRWKKITITYEGGQFEIILFSSEAEIPVVFEPITLSGALSNE